MNPAKEMMEEAHERALQAQAVAREIAKLRPEPSRLEIAANIYCALRSWDLNAGRMLCEREEPKQLAKRAVKEADALIAQAKGEK